MATADDGLNDSEATKILFKNLMSATSTSPYREFYDETDLANHSNFYSNGLLTDIPPKYDDAAPSSTIIDDVSLSEYLRTSGMDDISINSDWLDEKTADDSESNFFIYDDDENGTVLRLVKIKLDWLDYSARAFVCKDKKGQNILKNLIPPNYSANGYTIKLYARPSAGASLVEFSWLSDAAACDSIHKLSTQHSISNAEVGAPLFDAKNGIITFYDIGTSSQMDSVMQILETNGLYITATKYIGLSDVKTVRSLDVIGDLSVGRLTIGSTSIDVESKIDSLDTSVNYIEDVIGVDEYFVVTVVNSGSGNKYIINGIETPIIYFENNKTYRFDQSDSTNGGHPLILSTDNSTDTTNVSYQLNIGSPGSNGAYTEITINDDTPNILYYRCEQTSHTSMGSYMKNNINLVDLSMNALETATTDISYSASDTTTMFENNVRVNGSLDVSDTFYVDSSSGNVGIGTSDPIYTLHVDGDIYASGGVGIGKDKDSAYELDVSGDIHCTGTLFADSDLKVKKNLVPLDKSLDKLSNLNGYYYHKVGEEEYSLKHIGVIAQEVEAEYPELVSQNTHIKSVNYDGINAILIECVKELRKENLAIKSEMEELKNRFEKLEMNYN